MSEATAPFASITIPGPTPAPGQGWRDHAMQFLHDPIDYMRTMYSYGPIAAMAQDFSGWVFAFDPEYNQQILTNMDLFYTPVGLFTPRDTATYRLISGLRMNGPLHRQQRRLIMPPFHRKHVERYSSDIVVAAQRMLERWQPGQKLDIVHEMQQLMLQIASKTLLGLDDLEQPTSVGHMLERWSQIPSFSPTATIFPTDQRSAAMEQAHAFSAALEAQLQALVDQKRSNLDDQHDILALLMQIRDEDGNLFDDTTVIGEVATLFVAGRDTTVNGLTWTLFLLAQHPEVFQALADEVRSVVGADGSPHAPSVTQLAQLRLLEAVIQEALRLLPPVSYLWRISTAPFTLGPYQLPKGAIITLSQYMTHRLPELYPDPQQFRPERWRQSSPAPYAYFPFGAGPRMCIGMSLAMMELKLVLALLVQYSYLTVVPGARIDRQITSSLGPKYGMPMIVTPLTEPIVCTEVSGNIHDMVDLRVAPGVCP